MQNSDIWRTAWAIYLTHAKETDIRDHNTSSLSARNKLRLLSYTGGYHSTHIHFCFCKIAQIYHFAECCSHINR